MIIFIIAQLVGFVGYIFYIHAPQQKTTTSIIKIEAIACTILCIQWLLLGHVSLMAVNTLSVLTSIIALRIKRKPHLRYIIPLIYLGGSFMIFTLSHETLIDAFAIIAFICMASSKFSRNIMQLRHYAVLSSLCLCASAILCLSIPALIFNFLFTWRHCKQILKNNRAQTALSPSPKIA